MNNQPDEDNGVRKEVSEAEGSSWEIVRFVKHVLVGCTGGLALFLAVGAGCDYALSSLDWRFDSIDRRFNQQDRRFDRQDRQDYRQDYRFDLQDNRFDRQDYRFNQQDYRFDRQDKRFDRQDRRMDRIESTISQGVRLSAAQMDRLGFTVDRGFRQTHDRSDRTDTRIDRLEKKVDVLEAFLNHGRLHVVVEGDGATPSLVLVLDAFDGTKILPPRQDR